MKLSPNIFRAYDIRGEAYADFDAEGFFVIAYSFGRYIGEKFEKKNPQIFVSGDGRLSMDEMAAGVIAGLKEAGAEVTFGGTIPTPVNYFAFHEGDFDASIQISASHNPAKDNGLKLTDRKGAVCGEEIQKLRAMCDEYLFYDFYKQKILEFLYTKRTETKNNERLELMSVSEDIGEALEEILNVSMKNYTHVLDLAAVNHIFKRHGEGANLSENELAIVENDLGKIPEILSEPDWIVDGGKTLHTNLSSIRYVKTYADQTTYVVEEVRMGKKDLAIKTMFKNMGDARLPRGAAAVRLSDKTPTSSNDVSIMSHVGALVNEKNSGNFCASVLLSAQEVVDFFPAYLEKLGEITPELSVKKVVVDAGNGVAGPFYPEVFEKFGFEVERLFCALDGAFPNHQPDPERPENLKFAEKKLVEISADFAFVYDGDGDRMGVILRNPQTPLSGGFENIVLNADKIMYGLAMDFLSRNPGEKIVLDAMTSQTLIEKIREMGGEPLVSKTGHSFIEEAMHETGAKLGGEQSGHFMFGENFYGHDDAMLASLRFLQAVESHENLVDGITKDWPNLLEFSEKLTVDDTEKFAIVDRVAKKLQDFYGADFVSTLDGARIDYKAAGKGVTGEWAIIRCSNTSPKIAVRIEAVDAKSLEEKKSVILGFLEEETSE